MSDLSLSTTEIWPQVARSMLKEKNISVQELRSQFSQVVFPWHRTYSSYRFMFQLEIAELPLFVIVLHREVEAICVLNLLVTTKLRMRIISGRHNSAIQNPDFYLDISHLNSINIRHIDLNPPKKQDLFAESHRIEIKGGATQGQVYTHLFNKDNSKDGKSLRHVHFPGAKAHHPLVSLTMHPLCAEDDAVVFPGGSAGSVGVVGLTTCGGIGSLKRTLGLTIDSVLHFIIAVPHNPYSSSSSSSYFSKSSSKSFSKTAQIIVASRSQHSDLFWALCGTPAANFGIVLRVVYKARVVERILSYALSFEWISAKEVVMLWQRTAIGRNEQYNEDLSLFVNIPDSKEEILLTDCSHGPKCAYGTKCILDIRCNKNFKIQAKTQVKKQVKAHKGISIGGVYVMRHDETEAEGKAAIALQLKELRALPGAHGFAINATTYAETMTELASKRTYRPFSAAQLILSRFSLPGDKVSAAIHELESLVTKPNIVPGLQVIGMELLGGRISHKKHNTSAFFPRQSQFMIDIFRYWDSALYSSVSKRWVHNTFNLLYSPANQDNVYVGFPINGLPDHRRAYWGNNTKRLLDIKQKYDPTGLLRFPTGLLE